nr:MAG TPA: hypothetical protein [Crassvirales sp.]
MIHLLVHLACQKSNLACYFDTYLYYYLYILASRRRSDESRFKAKY